MFVKRLRLWLGFMHKTRDCEGFFLFLLYDILFLSLTNNRNITAVLLLCVNFVERRRKLIVIEREGIRREAWENMKAVHEEFQ
jgi:hypothetical protein